MNDRLPVAKFEVNFEDDALVAHPAYLETLTTPLAFWRMNAVSGANELDASGNGRTLDYSGSPTLQADGAFTSAYGDLNKSVLFNGVDEFAQTNVPSATWRNLTGPWTLMAWIYPTSALSSAGDPATTILGANPSGLTGARPFLLNYGRMDSASSPAASVVWAGYYLGGAWGGGATVAFDPTAPPLNTWTHYVATYDGATITLYRNGVSVAEKAAATNTAANTNNTYVLAGLDVHNGTYSKYYPGRLDEMAIWNVVLDANQVANLYRYLTITELDDANFVDLTAEPDTNAYGQELSRLRTFAPRRGRSDPVSRIGAGTATVVVSNHDGLLSPAPIVNMLANPSFESEDWATLPFTPQDVTVQRGGGDIGGGGVTGAEPQWHFLMYGESGTGGGYATTQRDGLIGMRPGRTYTFSAYVYVPSGLGINLTDVYLQISDIVGGSTDQDASGNPGSFDAWTRIEVTRTIRDSATDSFVQVIFVHGGNTSRFIGVDHVQLEEAASASTYADGLQADCAWLGEAHRSPTIRRADGYTKAGLPMRACRLSLTWDGDDYDVMHGYIERMQHSYPANGHDATVTYSVVDGTRILANVSMRGFSRSSERVGDRVRAILAFAGIPVSRYDVDDQWIDTLALSAQATVEDDRTALSMIQAIEETERGEFFVSRAGLYTYQGSLYRVTAGGSAVVFSDEDDTAEIRYSDVALTMDINTVANDVNIENVASGTVHTFDYPLSQARYFSVSKSEESLWSTDTATDDDRSIALPNAEQITVFGAKDPDAWWPTLLSLELGDLVEIQRHHAGQDLWQGYMHFLEGYSIDAGRDRFAMNFLTSPTLSHPIEPNPWQSPITRPIVHVSGRDAAAATSHVIPSRTYTAGRLYVMTLVTGTVSSITSANTWTATGTAPNWYWTIPSGTVTETVTVNHTSQGMEYIVMEIQEGFLSASPIGDVVYGAPGASGITGNQINGQLDVGTLTNANSVVLASVFKSAQAAITFSGAVELYDRVGTGLDVSSYAVAYGSPPGIDTIAFTWGGVANGWFAAGVEIEAS